MEVMYTKNKKNELHLSVYLLFSNDEKILPDNDDGIDLMSLMKTSNK